MPGDAYMRQWTWSSLVQIMACRLFGAKPLSEPKLTYCQLDPLEQTSIIFESKHKNDGNIVHKMASILSRPQYVNFNTSTLEKIATIMQMAFSAVFRDKKNI